MGVNQPIKIFISYATEDGDKASHLSESLAWLGFDNFLAHEDINKGEVWRDAIDENLNNADVFLPLLTDAAMASAWVNQESGIAHFLKRKKKNKFTIIPLVQGKQIPPGCLSIYQAQGLKVGFLGFGRVVISDEVVREIALEIVEKLKSHQISNDFALSN